MTDGDTTRKTVGSDSHRDPEAWCSERGHYRPERPRPGVPDGDITGPNGRSLVVPDGDITGPNGRGLVFRTGTFQARTAEACFSRTGRLQAQIPSTVSDGLAPSAFDPFLEYSTDIVVLFWQPRRIFRSGRLRRLSSTVYHILARSSFCLLYTSPSPRD